MSQSTLPSSSGGLPIPKVRLSSWNPKTDNFATIDRYKYGGNTVGWQYKLFRFPEVIAMDLTQDQIQKWVYVEMLSYHRGKTKYSLNADSAYKIANSWIWWANPLPTASTRSGQSNIHTNMWWWPLLVDHNNHYQVTAHNEVIPVRQYLHNRMCQFPVWYRDDNGVHSSVTCLVPAQWLRRFTNTPWNRFGYSSVYTPYYFKLRYIMRNDDNTDWISWPTSQTIKLCQEEHPFQFDTVASTTYNSTCVTINPATNPDLARCWFETRLP